MESIGTVDAVCSSPTHSFHKTSLSSIKIIEGLGVEGDAHSGEKIQHLSRTKVDPNLPNLRQVYLVAAEFFDELHNKGFEVKAGEIGENIVTSGIDLINLPVGTKLQIGESALVEVTGLRTPCPQLDKFQKGLMRACLIHDDEGNVVENRSGVMSIALRTGVVNPGDQIKVTLPPLPHQRLGKV